MAYTLESRVQQELDGVSKEARRWRGATPPIARAFRVTNPPPCYTPTATRPDDLLRRVATILKGR